MYNQPLAYFITFTTYGTWLHGDSRQSVLVENHSTKIIAPNERFYEHEQQRMKSRAVLFDEAMRQLVCDAIVERCLWKEWYLHACHVRRNHVHILVHSSESIDKVMVSLKAWCTRKLRQSGHQLPKVWTRHGSTQYVFTNAKLLEKIHYIVHEQGERGMFCVAGV